MCLCVKGQFVYHFCNILNGKSSKHLLVSTFFFLQTKPIILYPFYLFVGLFDTQHIFFTAFYNDCILLLLYYTYTSKGKMLREKKACFSGVFMTTMIMCSKHILLPIAFSMAMMFGKWNMKCCGCFAMSSKNGTAWRSRVRVCVFVCTCL